MKKKLVLALITVLMLMVCSMPVAFAGSDTELISDARMISEDTLAFEYAGTISSQEEAVAAFSVTVNEEPANFTFAEQTEGTVTLTLESAPEPDDAVTLTLIIQEPYQELSVQPLPVEEPEGAPEPPIQELGAVTGTLGDVALITADVMEIEYDQPVLSDEEAHTLFDITVDGDSVEWEYLSYFDFGPYADRGGVVNVRLDDPLDIGKPRIQRRAVVLFAETQSAKGAAAAAEITVNGETASFAPFYGEIQRGHMSQIDAWGSATAGNSSSNSFDAATGKQQFTTDYVTKQVGEGMNGMVGRAEYLNIPVIDSGLVAHVVGDEQSVYEDPSYRELYVYGETDDTYTLNHIPGTPDKPVIVTTADEVMRRDSSVNEDGESADGEPARSADDYFTFGEDFLRLYYHFGVQEGSKCFPTGFFTDEDAYRYDLQLEAAYEHAQEAGLWAGTEMMDSLENYYIHGAMIHFEMIPESSDGSWQTDRFPVNTREELHDYDEDLYNVLCGIHGRYHWFTGTPEQTATSNDFTNDVLKVSHPWFWQSQVDNYSVDGEREPLGIEHVDIISDNQIEIKFNREIETIAPAAKASNWEVYINGVKVTGTYTANGRSYDRVSVIGGYAWRSITLQVVPTEGTLDNGVPYGRDFKGFTQADIDERKASNGGWISDTETFSPTALNYGQLVTLQDALDAGADAVGTVEVRYVGTADVEDWDGNALDRDLHEANFNPWVGTAYRSPLTGFYIYADSVVADDTIYAAGQLYETDMLNNQTITYDRSAGGEDFPSDPAAQVVAPQNSSDRGAVTEMLAYNPNIATSSVTYDRVGQRIADGSVKAGGGMQIIGGYTYGHHAAMQPTARNQIVNGFHVWLYVEGWGGTIFQSDETMLLKDPQMTRYKNECLVFHEGGHGLDSFTRSSNYYAKNVWCDITAAWLTSISYENGRTWWNQYNTEGAYLRNRDEFTSTGSTFYHSTMREQFMGINDGTWTPINTREELYRYDPYSFEVWKRIYFTGELGLYYTDENGNSHVGDPEYRVMPEDWELLRDTYPEFSHWTSENDLIAWGASVPQIAQSDPYTGEKQPEVNWVSWNTPNVWDVTTNDDPAVATNTKDFLGSVAYNPDEPSPTENQEHPFFRKGGVQRPVRPAELEALVTPVKCEVASGSISMPRPVLVRFEIGNYANDITCDNAQTSFRLIINGQQTHFYFYDFKKQGDSAFVTLRLDWPVEDGADIQIGVKAFDPNVTSIEANPATFSISGGTSTITLTGENLPSGILVTAFAKGDETSISGATTGSSTSQAVALKFPGNNSSSKMRYTVKYSLDGGTTWEGDLVVTVVAKQTLIATGGDTVVEAPPEVEESYTVMPPTRPAGTRVGALKSNNLLYLGGAETAFPAVNIDGYNWLKLRDIAMLLAGTSKQFSLSYDPETGIIDIVIGGSYTPLGNELKDLLTEPITATASPQQIRLNGQIINIASYNIAGYNYFRLRDIAILLNFAVDYNNETHGIALDLTKPYTE